MEWLSQSPKLAPTGARWPSISLPVSPWLPLTNNLCAGTGRPYRVTTQAGTRWQHLCRRCEARAQRAGRRAGEQESHGWADIPGMGQHSVCGDRTGPGGGGCMASVLWWAGTGQMPGPSRANEETEPMRHTEVKMDRSPNTTPTEFNHRGRQSVLLSRMELFEEARLSLQASIFPCLPAQHFSPFIWHAGPQRLVPGTPGGWPPLTWPTPWRIQQQRLPQCSQATSTEETPPSQPFYA